MTMTQVDGLIPTRANIYMTSRKRKDGTAVNEKVKDLMDLMKKYQSDASSSTSKGVTSWQGDVYSKVKGDEKKDRVRCLGAVAPSKSFNAITFPQSNIHETLNGLFGIISRMVQMLKEQFPNANIDDIMQHARQLAMQVEAGQAEASHARRVPSNSHGDKGSSSSIYQP